MGRTTIDKSQSIGMSYGKTANKILNEIENHKSHASSTYYYKNYMQYFSEILRSIHEIGRVLKKNGLFVCVVQDSFYKEIYCDLAKTIIEMSNSVQLELISRRDFDARVVMANIHTGTKKYRSKINAKESVLMFKSTK
jgi:ubiquinone/menaquinone biosynthesis C-methylase UbiE